MKMESEYPLEWLDSFVGEVLISAGPVWAQSNENQIETVLAAISGERQRQEAWLKRFAFSALPEKQVRFRMQRYYDALTLIDVRVRDLTGPGIVWEKVRRATQTLIEEILTFFVKRFKGFLDPETPLPIIYSEEVLQALASDISKLAENLATSDAGHEICGILAKEIEKVKRLSITISSLAYFEKLTSSLTRLGASVTNLTPFHPLDILLINFNFNSTHYIAHLEKRIYLFLELLDGANKKEEAVQEMINYIQQIPDNQEGLLAYSGESIVGRLTGQLKAFLKSSSMKDADVSDNNNPQSAIQYQSRENAIAKVMCNMSVDQLAIFLKAADETRLFSARSLSAILKAIVPFLSTPTKETLSWESVRTKTYAVEEKDQAIVIGFLTKMIERVREF